MSSQPLRLALVGAAGRMGGAILEVVEPMEDVRVVAAVERPGSSALGARLLDAGIAITGDLSEHIASVDVVIDFSSPESCLRSARIATEASVRFVTGTTGLSAAQCEELRECSAQAAVLHAANFSVGVNVLARLVELASAATGEGFDLELFESHHRHKVDAPSGTALMLGRAAAAGRGWELEDVATWGRKGDVGPRAAQTIGFQVARGGDIVGEHTLMLCGDGERLELTHRATDRRIFARGAVRAARWIAAQRPGFYAMSDVLFP